MNPHNVTDEHPAAGTGRSGAGCDASATHQSAPNILIVDDKPSNLKLLVEVLARRGYRTRTVVSGKLALQAAHADPPDLILLDIKMPEMDGYEVCGILKADAALKDIPVIFISALDEAIDKVRALRVGGVDYVTKPFHFEEVYARVETHLRIRSLQCQLSAQNENLERMVAERTRDLSNAYARMRELGRLKNDFLSMISHEIRTPANGFLGVGTLILGLCPASEERSQYAGILKQSGLRLRNLIEDAGMISDMENLTMKTMAAISFPELLAEVSAALPDLRISMAQSPGLELFPLNGYPPLLEKAMESVILLATCFSRDKHHVDLTAKVEESVLRVHIELDALSLSSEQATGFFGLESQVRSVSVAQSLGLAPVVAYQILSAFGGNLQLVKADGPAGCLELTFLKDQSHAKPVDTTAVALNTHLMERDLPSPVFLHAY